MVWRCFEMAVYAALASACCVPVLCLVQWAVSRLMTRRWNANIWWVALVRCGLCWLPPLGWGIWPWFAERLAMTNPFANWLPRGLWPLSWIWFIGMLAGCVYVGWNVWGFRIYTHGLKKMKPSPELCAALDEAAYRTGVYHKPVVFALPMAASPMIAGFRSPKLYLHPESFLAWPVEAQQAVLCHELIHWRRRDTAFFTLSCLILATQWFNPFCWLAVWRMTQERELAVDEAVIACTDRRETLAYAQALISVQTGSNKLHQGFAAFRREKAVHRRIRHIVKHRRYTGQGILAVLLAALLIILALFNPRPGNSSWSATPDVASPGYVWFSIYEFMK